MTPRLSSACKIITIMLLVCLPGCSGPYDDLQSAFGNRPTSATQTIPVKKVVLGSTHYRGAYNYGASSLTVKLARDAVEIEPAFPLTLGMKPVAIAASEVSGCTCSSFGDMGWHANLLIGRTGTEISFEESKEIFDWCWSNHLPIIPGDDERRWLYSNGTLPEKSKFADQFASRERFDDRRKRSCQGF